MTAEVPEEASSVAPPTGSTAQSTGASIDEFVPADWPSEVVTALDVWKQGDLIGGSPRFWAGPGRDDPIVGTSGSGLAWDLFDAGSDGGFVAVTTQTCDIAAFGPGRQ